MSLEGIRVDRKSLPQGEYLNQSKVRPLADVGRPVLYSHWDKGERERDLPKSEGEEKM